MMGAFGSPPLTTVIGLPYSLFAFDLLYHQFGSSFIDVDTEQAHNDATTWQDFCQNRGVL